ncbi:hypothetical protein AB4Y36_38045 [Paraburkholderia sp. BR10936]|uniref:hypothetical protein n=1 Tax=Paraburkholderia sp. BR10936 TaxID=3236993 RepID=UPI0034D24489
MMNLADVVLDPEWVGEWPIHRRSGHYDAGGHWVETLTPGTITAAIHPASDDAMAMLPEGERYLEGIKVYALEPVRQGDQIEWHGDRWRVARLQDYSDYGFYDATATRLGGTTVPGGGAFATP